MAPGGGYDKYDLDMQDYLAGLQAIENLRNLGGRDQWLQGQEAQLSNNYANNVAGYWTKPKTGAVSFAPGGFGPEGRWSNRAEDAWIQPGDKNPAGQPEVDRRLSTQDWQGMGHPLFDITRPNRGPNVDEIGPMQTPPVLQPTPDTDPIYQRKPVEAAPWQLNTDYTPMILKAIGGALGWLPRKMQLPIAPNRPVWQGR